MMSMLQLLYACYSSVLFNHQMCYLFARDKTFTFYVLYVNFQAGIAGQMGRTQGIHL